MLTEDQIERRVEKMIDYLDRMFMAGKMTQADYDKRIADTNKWAEAKYLERDANLKGFVLIRLPHTNAEAY